MRPGGRKAAAIVALTLCSSLAGGAQLAAPERHVLATPGRFVVMVNTNAHPEDRPNAPLPFPAGDLLPPLRNALRDAGVPVADRSTDLKPARALYLHLNLLEEAKGYAYVLSLQPDAFPGDPLDVIYDDSSWPVTFGESSRAALFNAMASSLQVMAVEFGKLYVEATREPSKVRR